MRLPEAEWREIKRLAEASDIAGLPHIIGCPDCADRGAQSLTIETPDGAQTISFGYGAAVQQAHPLLARVRMLLERVTPRN